MPETQSSLRHYLQVLRNQAWLIALSLLIALAAAAFALSRQTSIYQANMKMTVTQGGNQVVLNSDASRTTATMASLLKSIVVGQTAIRNLGLNTTPESFLAPAHVTIRPEASVLEISYTSASTAQAVRNLRELGRVFTALVRENFRGDPKAGVQPIRVTVFDDAHLVPGRISPRPKRTLAFAGVLGVVLGLILAFARESLDDRIRSRRDAEEWFGAPVIGSLPKGARGKPPPGIGSRRTRRSDELVEALDLLRANVQFAQAGGSGRTILVTSALPEEGKSTLVANLGVALARAGNDVICVEADLHRPRLNHYLAVTPPKAGVADVLQGKIDVRRALQDVQLGDPSANGAGPNWKAAGREVGAAAQRNGHLGRLRVLPTGELPSTPSAVLTTRAISDLIEKLRSDARYIIFDAPPLLLVADAFPLVLKADSVLVVARQSRTTKHNAEAVRMTLEGLGAEHVSVVLTDAPQREGGYGYAYGGYRAAKR